MSYVSGYYTGAPVFDATAIDAEFTSDQEFFAAMMEVTWREPSASGYTSTNTAPLNVHNDVIKEGEELPALLLGGVPGTSAEAELVFAATSGVPDSGTLRSGWR